MTEKELIGKTIKNIEVDGFSVYIIFTDNTSFSYYASDGGYSMWECQHEAITEN